MSLPFAYFPVGAAAQETSNPGSTVNAPSSIARLEPWSPDLRSSNITSLTQFPVGAQFSVRVNVTNPEQMTGYDVSVNYNITAGPNPLQALKTGLELFGSLMDPANPPAGCSVLVARNLIDMPPGRIRFAAVLVGGCSVSGTGTLFTLWFKVSRIGATSINIILTDSSGKTVTIILGPGPSFPELPFEPVNAYFRNKAGVPPVASFAFNPSNPARNQTVLFDASASYDPGNYSMPGKGIRRYYWFFGDLAFGYYLTADGVQASHVFTFSYNVPAVGSFSVHLVVWDVDNDLPSDHIEVVTILPGPREGLSINWSGYIVEGSVSSVSQVTGSWKVPSIVGSCPATDQHASFWVGIDGSNSPTVEQVGTESACISGQPQYFAWYEFYPKNPVLIKKMTLSPGDIITAQVSAKQDRFTVSIQDVTSGASFSKSERVKGAFRSSAEWIAEAPSNTSGIVPLANFGRIIFGHESTGQAGTCSVTIGGTNGPIGAFNPHIIVVVMVNSALVIKALPSTLSPDQSSFFVDWKSAL